MGDEAMAAAQERQQHAPPQPMNLLLRLYGEPATTELLSETRFVRHLVRVEQVVAEVQGELGVIPEAAAAGIVKALDAVTIDEDLLWSETRVVGYPVLPLIRQIDGQLDQHLRGYLHWGLTTQDVMDTALVLQIREVVDRQYELIRAWGYGLSVLTREWSGHVAPARTHGQQAVPTTIGARFGVFLEQVADLSGELIRAADRAAVVSMHGAGGTSAAMGSTASDVRRRSAELLHLRFSAVPWHVARHSLVQLTGVLTALTAVAARLAKDVVDLSRDEIAEVGEMVGPLRGASSTMPQKANPIDAEAIIGLSWSCTGAHLGMIRALEAGHERAAGEWQIEWSALPTVLLTSASAFAVAARLSAGLRVDSERAAANAQLNGGAILAEAYMMRLAESIGREEAHELVYRSVRDSRRSGRSLHDAVSVELDRRGLATVEVRSDGYVGDARETCRAAQASWASAVSAIDSLLATPRHPGSTPGPTTAGPNDGEVPHP